MAGGFNGDDEDYNNYEQNGEEESSEDGEESYYDYDGPVSSYYGDEDEDDEDDDDDEDENDDENKFSPMQKKFMELEEKRLRPKLEKLIQKLQTRQFPFLTPFEKQDLEKAKKHKKLKTLVTACKLRFSMLQFKFAGKAISAIAPAIPYIFMGCLIFAAIALIVALIASIMPWLFPDDNLSDGSGGSSASFGVSGKDFYGVRTIYKNDELARSALLESYSELIEDVRENLLTYTKTITREEENGEGEPVTVTYNVSIEIDLSDLTTLNEKNEEVEFDFSEFDETKFSSTYNDYYTLLTSIVDIVYKIDSPDATTPTTLNEKLDLIKYFGLSDVLINTTETNAENDVDDVILNYFTDANNYTYIVTDNNGNEANIELTEEEKISTEDITNKVNETLNALELIRTEKLFIKDYTFATEDDMMKGVEEQNYVAWIFMPKNNVTFTKFSFSVTHEDFDNFTLKLFNNGSEVSITKEDVNWSDLGTEESANATPSYTYIANNVSVSASIFTDIDSSKIDALSSATSLAEIVKNSDLNNDMYVQTNEDGYYTYKSNGIYVTFESEISFKCVEFETLWS